MNVLLIYPQFPDTFWSFKYALEFIGKKINNPPLGLMTISAMLPSNWSKKLVDLNLYSLDEKDILWADMVFISAMDVQRNSCHKIINKVKTYNKTIVAGGPLFTGEYDKFPQIDHFILNEGELTLKQFLLDLEKGIEPKHIYSTDQYAQIQNSPLPDISLINIHDYECMSIQFSRGCPYQCDFCNVTALLGHKPRTKTVDQVIAELDMYFKAGWKRNVFFVDDNFIGNKEFLKKEVLPAIIDWRRGKKGFTFITEASINMADDPVLLDLLAKAGFTQVFIGIETPNESSLIECKKNQNIKRDLVKSIKKIHQSGIQVMAGFIVGFDNDTPAIFNNMIDFIQESGIVTAMVGILQAPNGTKLYQRLEKEGRILHEMSGDNADGSTNIITKMDELTLKTGYKKIINTIYSPEYHYPRIQTMLSDLRPVRLPGGVYAKEIMAFMKTIFRMGLKKGERLYYWRLLFWTLLHCPSNFPFAITMSIYGYHFRKVNKLNQQRDIREANRLISMELKKGAAQSQTVSPRA